MASKRGGWGQPIGKLPERSHIILSERIELEPDGRYSAFCDDLGIATFAESHPKAQERLRSAILAILNEAQKEGEVLELLRSKEIRLHSPHAFRASTGETITRIAPSGSAFTYHGINHQPYDVFVGAH
jgi:predicted RNase H-like HicB family nuclease